MTKSLQLGLWGGHRAELLLSKLEQEKAVRKRREKIQVFCRRVGVMCGMIFFVFAKFVEQLSEKSCSNLMGRLSLENTGRGCPMPGQKCPSFMVRFTLLPSPYLLLAETKGEAKNGFP